MRIRTYSATALEESYGIDVSAVDMGPTAQLGVGAAWGRVAPGVARREAPIFVGATPVGAPRGSLAAGGSVLVHSIASGFAEISARCGELVPADKEHFFVEAFQLRGTPLRIQFKTGVNPYADTTARR